MKSIKSLLMRVRREMKFSPILFLILLSFFYLSCNEKTSVQENSNSPDDSCQSCDNLSDALKHPDYVRAFIFYNDTFNDSIESFQKLKNISVLIFQESPLTYKRILDRLAAVLKKVKKISFQNCRMDSIPSSLSSFKLLDEVEINDSIIINDLSALSMIPTLSYLNLMVNGISDFNIDGTSQLKELNLFFYKQHTIPVGIYSLNKLSRLSLQGEIDSVGNEIRNLKQLQKLDIYNSKIIQDNAWNKIRSIESIIPNVEIITSMTAK